MSKINEWNIIVPRVAAKVIHIFGQSGGLRVLARETERFGPDKDQFYIVFLAQPDNLRKEGSIDLVQCLLLMSQYLQCTNQPHQTWVTVGSAVRIAQSLSLHLTGVRSTPGDVSVAFKRRVWQSCVIMDRYDEKHPICRTKLILDLEQYALLMGDPQ